MEGESGGWGGGLEVHREGKEGGWMRVMEVNRKGWTARCMDITSSHGPRREPGKEGGVSAHTAPQPHKGRRLPGLFSITHQGREETSRGWVVLSGSGAKASPSTLK